MLRIVLPVSTPGLAATGLAAIDVVNVILVKIILVVDVDVAVVPVAVAPGSAGPGTQRKSGRAPRQPHAGVVPRIGIRVIRIGRGRRSINHRRVVRRNVNHVGLSRFYYDNLLAAFYCFGLNRLLRAGL